MPLEGSGNVARPFCCRAGAWWPTLANKAIWLRTYSGELEGIGPAAPEGAATWPEVMARLLL